MFAAELQRSVMTRTYRSGISWAALFLALGWLSCVGTKVGMKVESGEGGGGTVVSAEAEKDTNGMHQPHNGTQLQRFVQYVGGYA